MCATERNSHPIDLDDSIHACLVKYLELSSIIT